MSYTRKGLGQTGNSLIDSLANAIARMEGYNVAGSVAQRNNNPGNLRAGTGQIGTDANGYAIFPSVDAGFAALDNQIQLNINRGLTLTQFFQGKPGVYAGYAPAADSNDPTNYANTVAGWLGIDPNTQLSSLSPGTFHLVPLLPHPTAPRT
jgi:hypothetical protein